MYAVLRVPTQWTDSTWRRRDVIRRSILLGYRSQSPACPSPVFGRNPSSSSSSSSSSALLRAVSWPGGKTPKSPGDQGEGDDGQATRRQLSDPPHSKQQFQSLATDVKNASKYHKAASKNTGIKFVRQWCPKRINGMVSYPKQSNSFGQSRVKRIVK